jgi:hypothetical protein
MGSSTWTPDDTPWTPADAAAAEIRDTVRNAQKIADEPNLQNLVSADDPDWQAFQADDPEWFLRAAGRVIRQYVGWHIFPNIQETVHKIQTGSRGLLMLPSRYVTQVDRLSIRMDERQPTQWVDPREYVWHKAGWIQRKGWAYYAGWYYAGYYYGNDPYYLPVWETGFASCTFWHGYATLPDDIKEIAYELASQSMTVPAGNVKMLEAPGGFKAQTSQPFGMTLNPDQKDRLASYRLGMIA